MILPYKLGLSTLKSGLLKLKVKNYFTLNGDGELNNDF